jgi:hypothetical protein
VRLELTSASMAQVAWKRSTVRTRPGPPNFSNSYRPPAKNVITGVQLESKPYESRR